MPNYKVVDAGRLDAAMTATADAIREKTSGTDSIPWNAETGFAEAVAGITGSGAAVSVPMKDVNFYDYDGTRLYSYTVEEAAALTELPPLPTQDGLICQGWNWTLDKIKAMGRAVDVGAMYITDDGKTRIYISLPEGRTSPVMAVAPNGTVTIDWGDETEPYVMTGTSSAAIIWTSKHQYAAPGDYVITLDIDGTMTLYGTQIENEGSAILRHSAEANPLNTVYNNAIRKVEFGRGVPNIRASMFCGCGNLESVTVTAEMKNVGNYAFCDCHKLKGITIPQTVTTLRYDIFRNCHNLRSVAFSKSATIIGTTAFEACYSLDVVAIPDGVTTVEAKAFRLCKNAKKIIFPGTITMIGYESFWGCKSVIKYDFLHHTSVPTLNNSDAFEGIPEDCEIRVPAALADEWKAATNWSTYADYIVGG